VRIDVHIGCRDCVSSGELGGALRKVVDELGHDPVNVAKALIGDDAQSVHVVTASKNDGFQDFALQEFFDQLVEDHAKVLKKTKKRMVGELDRASDDA
jgi:hypothetical protein